MLGHMHGSANPVWTMSLSKVAARNHWYRAEQSSQKSNEMPRWKQSPRIWVYAHAVPLDGDHATALSGTLWRVHTWMVARKS